MTCSSTGSCWGATGASNVAALGMNSGFPSCDELWKGLEAPEHTMRFLLVFFLHEIGTNTLLVRLKSAFKCSPIC